MSRADLISLPPELLLAICSELCWHCARESQTTTPCLDENPKQGLLESRENQTDLLSISRVCRKLHATAESFLYHCLHLSREWDLYFLLRTLSERPELASRVLEVEIGSMSRVPPTAHGDSHPTTTSTEPTFAAVQEYLSSPGGSIPPHGSPTSPDADGPTQHTALLLLLLRLAPNLERLHLPPPAVRPSEIVSRSSSSGPLSTSLETLILNGFEHEYLLDEAVPIMRHAPNLKILRFHGHVSLSEVFAASLGRTTPAEPPPLQNITELALIETFLTASSFRHLLKAVGPRLSKVHIRRTATQRLPSVYDEDDIIEFDEALAALQPWHNTLKELSFTIYGRVLSQGPRRLQGVRLLREFHALEMLWAQAAFFDFYGHMGPQGDALTATLPNPIRGLRLFGYSNLAPALQGLVGILGSGQFPNLRTVEIDDQGFEEYEPEAEAAQELRDVAASFRSAGRRFIIHPQPTEPEDTEEFEVEQT